MKISRVFSCLFLAAIVAGFAGRAEADPPLQMALYNPLQLVNEEKSIFGLRLNALYSVNEDMTGIDIGIINQTNGYQKGFQLGIFNFTSDMTGIQIGFFNKTDWLDGIQMGLINIASMEEDRRFMPFFNYSF